MGHQNLEKFKKMVSKLSHLKSLECDSRRLGKHARASLFNIINKLVSPFDLNHSNVWGPNCVILVLGCKFYVTFIDKF